MSAPRIILIDNDKERVQHFSAVIQFLEYTSIILDIEDVIQDVSLLNNSLAIFVGDSLVGKIKPLKKLFKVSSGIPIILLINQGASLSLPAVLQQEVTLIQEWPATYTELMDSFQLLQPRIQTPLVRNDATRSRALSGASPLIDEVCDLVSQVAQSDATVLILGESGTGKELVARALHNESARRDNPFVPVNCGAIPAELLESELFGHEKGAFTGAQGARKGRFEMAEGGTLFLDEIGDMPLPMQVKLLRVLQERTFERVGGTETVQCNVRVVSATHRDIEAAIDKDLFRQDLFYRLNVFPIELPALHEHTEDISILIQDLIARQKLAVEKRIHFSADALKVLMAYQWPGNVRELANLIERLTIIKPGGLIEVADLPKKIHQSVDTMEPQRDVDVLLSRYAASITDEGLTEYGMQLPEEGLDLKNYLSAVEISLIKQALASSKGVVAHAAKKLTMRRTTLVEKLKKFNL